MGEYKEVQRTISIPRNTGRDGFLHTVGELLALSHVQRIVIDATGSITYKRMVLNGEENHNLNVDFSHLQPYHIIRNGDTREHLFSSKQAASTVVAGMLDEVARESLSPIAFVTGKETALWSWYFFSTGVELSAQDRLFGYPLHTDRSVPGTALVLCAGMGRTSALVDTKLSLKVEMPRHRIMNDDLEIL